MQEIKLNETTSVYKIKYDFLYTKEELLERAYQVIELKKTHKIDVEHFFYIPFRCKEIDYVNNLVLEHCLEIDKKKYREWAVQNWIYKMNCNTAREIYHTHIDLIEGDGRIQTDWTFCLYVQIPKNISGDDGKIVFRTSDGVDHLFLPEEGDLYLFSADLEHTPKLIKESEMDRVVIAGNISLNPLRKIKKKELV